MAGETILGYDPLFLALAVAAMLLAGFVKGAVGFALPMVAAAGIGTLTSAQETVALMVMPTLASNLWLALRQGIGPALASARRFWKLNLLLVLTIGLAAQLVPRLSSAALFLVLGLVVSGAAAIQLAGWKPRPVRDPRETTRREVLTGVVSGIMGGLTGVWSPPVVFYLLSLELEKRLQVRSMGFTFMLGAVVLVPARAVSGIFDGPTALLSTALCLPMALGMWLGLMVQDRLPQETFRRLTLVVLCLAGLNLLRRALT